MGEIIERRLKSGQRVFYARYYENGKRKQVATKKPNLTEARGFLAKVESRISDGKVGVIERTKEDEARATITVKELCDRFVGDVEDVPGYASPKLKDVDRYRMDAKSNLKRILPTIEKEPAAKITALTLERLRDALMAGEDPYAPRTVALAFAVLSRAYTWGRKAGHLDCPNPVAGCEKPRATSSIDFLDRDEVGRLLSTAEDLAVLGVASWETITLWPMVATAIYTGMRKGELFGLRWRDVHFDANRIDVMHSYRLAPKSGKARHLPLHPELARILKVWQDRCPKTDEHLVFPTIGGEHGRWHMGESQDLLGLPDLLTAAGCHLPEDGRPWHMLRHTFASHFMMSGGNILTLQKLLGHYSVQMTMIYAHLSPDHLAAEVARMSFPAADGTVDEIAEARRLRLTNGTRVGT